MRRVGGRLGASEVEARALDIARVYVEATPALRRYVRRHLRDRDAEDDLVQDAFLRLSGQDAPSALRNPAAWLQRVARNLIVDRARKERAQRTQWHIALDGAELPPVAPEQSHALEAEDMLRRYEAALAKLGDRSRDVFLLHRIEELSYRQIADRLGISVATVEYHMMRALAHFDRLLSDE